MDALTAIFGALRKQKNGKPHWATGSAERKAAKPT